MNKPTKSEIVPGLLLASARYREVMVVGWWKGQSKGIVRCRVWTADGEREVLLPASSLRWQ